MLPGVVGAICLLLGLFALQMLPVNYAGLGLILLGIGFLVAEVFLPTFGSLGVGGDRRVRDRRADADRYRRARLRHSAAADRGGDVVVTALFVFVVSTLALQARRRPVVTGAEAMIGSVGVMLDDSRRRRSGWARVHGERWRVRSAESQRSRARASACA